MKHKTKSSKKKASPKKRLIKEKKAMYRFVIILAIISTLGFMEIVSEALFDYTIKNYVEAILILLLGIGILMEVKYQKLKSVHTHGLTRDNFANIIAIVIGLFSVFAGIFSFPQIKINSPSFHAINGILAVIAISIIIIQTWFVKQRY